MATDQHLASLAELVTGRNHWDGPFGIPLATDLDRSLTVVVGRLDRLCEAALVHDR